MVPLEEIPSRQLIVPGSESRPNSCSASFHVVRACMWSQPIDYLSLKKCEQQIESGKIKRPRRGYVQRGENYGNFRNSHSIIEKNDSVQRYIPS